MTTVGDASTNNCGVLTKKGRERVRSHAAQVDPDPLILTRPGLNDTKSHIAYQAQPNRQNLLGWLRVCESKSELAQRQASRGCLIRCELSKTSSNILLCTNRMLHPRIHEKKRRSFPIARSQVLLDAVLDLQCQRMHRNTDQEGYGRASSCVASQ